MFFRFSALFHEYSVTSTLAVVSYPKYPLRGSIRFLAHNDVDQLVEAFDAVLVLHKPKTLACRTSHAAR